MGLEVFGALGLSGGFKVCGGGAEDAGAIRDLAHDEGAVPQHGHADRDIDRFMQQVDQVVGQAQADIDQRKGFAELRDHRPQHAAANPRGAVTRRLPDGTPLAEARLVWARSTASSTSRLSR